MDSYCISPEYDWVSTFLRSCAPSAPVPNLTTSSILLSQTRNSVDEGPCVVARRLMNLCNPVPRYYPLRRLDEGTVNEHYPSPSQQQATPCMCSSAFPSLSTLTVSLLTPISVPVYNLLQLCVAVRFLFSNLKRSTVGLTLVLFSVPAQLPLHHDQLGDRKSVV